MDQEQESEHLRTSGVEIERSLEGVVGAQGEGKALYVRDPDGYMFELKIYGPHSPQGDDRE